MLSKRYEELLHKYAHNSEIYELIEHTVTHKFKAREYERVKEGYYGENVDALGMLYMNLITVKNLRGVEKDGE